MPACALVAAGLFAPRLLPAALVFAGLFWPIRWLAGGRLSRRTPGDWPAACLLLMAPVTLWATPLPAVTRPQVAGLLAGLALYYALANWACSARRAPAIACGIGCLGAMLALAAPVTVQWYAGAKPFLVPASVYARLPLLAADPVHPNVMAGTVAMLLPVPAALVLFRWRRSTWLIRTGAVLGGLLMLAVVVLAKSRGGLLAAGAALLLLVGLRWRHGWLAALLTPLAGGLLAWRLGAPAVFDVLAAGGTAAGLNGRLEIWSRAAYMLQDFPLTGIGMGTFKQVANALYPFVVLGPDADVPHAHNLFLQVGVDLGVPGLLAYIGLLALTAWSLIAVLRRSDAFRWLAAGLLGSLAALCVHGLCDAVTWGTRSAIVTWAVLGLAAALPHLAVED